MSAVAIILGFVYILAALPVTYAVVVTSAFEYSAPLQGVADFASRGFLLLALLSFPVLTLTAGSLLVQTSSLSSISDLWPLLLPGLSLILLAANALIPRPQNVKVE